MATARQHHYIPQFYLRGFSKSGSKNSKIVVLDAQRSEQYETNVRNIGGERDFNRVDLPGVSPDALEAGYAGFEGGTAQALQRIHQTLKFEGDDRIYILNLAALLAVRHPLMRKEYGRFQADIARKIVSLSLATKERWESIIARMKAEGDEVSTTLTYEEIKRSWEQGGYEIDVPREEHIRVETTVTFEPVLRTMVDRNWVMLVTDEESDPFITCDRPVSIMWHKPLEVPPMFRDGPGYGMPNTEVVFPLSKKLALIGNFGGRDAVLKAPPDLVGNTNSHVISFAKQVYAPKLGFHYRDPVLRQLVEGNRLLSILAQRRRARP